MDHLYPTQLFGGGLIIILAIVGAFTVSREACADWSKLILFGAGLVAAGTLIGHLLGLNVHALLTLMPQGRYVLGMWLADVPVFLGYTACMAGPLLLYRNLYENVLDKQRAVEWEDKVRKTAKARDEQK
jgi:hypothetical protein